MGTFLSNLCQITHTKRLRRRSSQNTLPRTLLNKEKESEACPIVSARFLACLTQRTGGAAGTALAGEYSQGHQRARCSSQPQTDQGSVVQDQGTEPGS